MNKMKDILGIDFTSYGYVNQLINYSRLNKLLIYRLRTLYFSQPSELILLANYDTNIRT